MLDKLKHILKLIVGILLCGFSVFCALGYALVDKSLPGTNSILVLAIIAAILGVAFIIWANRKPKGKNKLVDSSTEKPITTDHEPYEVSLPQEPKDLQSTFVHMDSDDNIPQPEGAEISYLDACALNFWNKRRTDFLVPQYYRNTAFGRNVEAALERLLAGGYLRRGDIEKSISLKLVPELKAILSERELKVSGKKAELVQRIMDNIPTDELEDIFSVGVYEITEKGEIAQQPYAAIFESQKHGLGISKYRLIQAKEQHPEDSTEKILLTALKDDLDSALQNGQKDEYQRTALATAGYLEKQNELHFALQYYCLAYFLWVIDAQEWISGTGGPTNRNMTARMADVSLIMGMSLDELIAFFTSTIRNADVFSLATKENIEIALHYLRSGLGAHKV